MQIGTLNQKAMINHITTNAVNFDIIYFTKLKRLTTEAITLLKCQNTYDRGLIKSMEEDIKQIDIDLLPFNN